MTTHTILEWQAPSTLQRLMVSNSLFWTLPWRRIASKSILEIKLAGALPEKPLPGWASFFKKSGDCTSMPDLCSAIRTAAHDPRISGLVLKLDSPKIGLAQIEEIREHIRYFRAAGKESVAFMERGLMFDYFLACACEEIYVPPVALLWLRGFCLSSAYLKSGLQKAGVVAAVKKEGKYKSAADMFERESLSDANREQLGAILEDLQSVILPAIAEARGRTVAELEALLDAAPLDMKLLQQGGWVTDLKYWDEVQELLKPRTGGKKDSVASVKLTKYQHVSPSTFGLSGGKTIAVLRAVGMIPAVAEGAGNDSILAAPFIEQLEKLVKDRSVAGIVLRINSPGGDVVASDVMWRAIKLAADQKPLVASMGDVAASGGYYMAMATPTIVAEPLTITGSIGVISCFFNMQKLFSKVGLGIEKLSKGRLAELDSLHRPWTADEDKYVTQNIRFLYEGFRDKAATCRNMSPEAMDAVAQGRIWSGRRALDVGLVDHLGGVHTAVALVKKAANIPKHTQVTIREVSKAKVSPTSLLLSSTVAAAHVPALPLGQVFAESLQALATQGVSAMPMLMQVAADRMGTAHMSPGQALMSQPQLMSGGGLAFSHACQYC